MRKDAGAATPLAVGVAAAVVAVIGAVAIAVVPAMGGGTRPAALTTAPPAPDPPYPEPTYPDPTYPDPTYPDPTYVEPTETVTAGAVPPGYRSAQGAEGLTVAVPQIWTLEPVPDTSNVQAVDPADDCLVRFGGSAAEAATLAAAVDAQVPGLSSRPEYELIQQQAVDYGSADEAVDWEFTFRADTGPRHAYGRYWRMGGTDYVVYGSCSTAAWPAFGEVLSTAFATADPH